VPLKRSGVADANEVPGLVASLASDRASFITGSGFDVDGVMKPIQAAHQEYA